MSLRSWLHRKAMDRATTQSNVRGLAVTVVNTRPDVDTAEVLARLDAALSLLERYVPHHFRRLKRDFSRILVQRFACRGAYFPADRSCLVELTFAVNKEFTPSQVAATILHEAMHARLDRIGYVHDAANSARHERFCRRAEVEFGQLAPDGAAVVQRALQSLEASDEDVAPAVDWALAERRVAQVDVDALRAPRWLKRVIAQRRGLKA